MYDFTTQGTFCFLKTDKWNTYIIFNLTAIGNGISTVKLEISKNNKNYYPGDIEYIYEWLSISKVKNDLNTCKVNISYTDDCTNYKSHLV